MSSHTTVLEIEIVVARLNGGLIRETVGELERTEAGFHLVWRRDGRWSFGGHLHLRSVGPTVSKWWREFCGQA
jgi:hypothetical protein